MVDAKTKSLAAEKGKKKVQCQLRLGVFWPLVAISRAINGLRCSRLRSKGQVRSAVAARRARETAVLRGRTTADQTDVAAGRGCKKTHAVVHEGIPGRVINRSRRGSARNTVKTLEDRIEAPRLFARSTAADVPGVGRRAAGYSQADTASNV